MTTYKAKHLYLYPIEHAIHAPMVHDCAPTSMGLSMALHLPWKMEGRAWTLTCDFFVPLVLATPLTSYIELARSSRGMVNLFRTTRPSSHCPPHSSRFFTTRNRSPNWHTINYFLLVSTYLGKHMRNRSNVSPKSTEWTFICLFLQRKMMVEGENVHTYYFQNWLYLIFFWSCKYLELYFHPSLFNTCYAYVCRWDKINSMYFILN